MAARLLLIDDDPAITRSLRNLLEISGFQVREENDPRRAMEAAREFQPDLLILDFLMPDLDGAEVAWIFKNDPEASEIPVIVSTGAPVSQVRKRMPPNVQSILPKHTQFNEILHVIREKLRWGVLE